MRKITTNLILPVSTVLVMCLSIAGPELFARYRDKAILGQIHTKVVQADGEGYRYTLSPGEKLYILSESLDSQTLPESGQYALTREGAWTEGAQGEPAEGSGYVDGTYAFVVNHNGPSGKEITDRQIYESCNQGLAALKEMGVLPDTVRDVDSETYDAALYTAIDVLEPRNNVAVWKLDLSNIQRNTDRENRVMNAYIDADDGKIYEIYARTPLTWEEMDPDRMVEEWSRYMGLEPPTPYETENPLVEATPYFRKYVCSGVGDEKTTVTVGFYEGINELFIRISSSR